MQLSCHVVNSSRLCLLQAYRSAYTRNMPLALVHKGHEAKVTIAALPRQPITATPRRQNFKHIPRRHLGLADVA